MDSPSAEILNEEDLEDGEIFEEEEPGEEKSTPVIPQEKLKPMQPVEVVAPPVVKKPEEVNKNHKTFENDKTPREQQNVPFFNRGKRKHFDDEEDQWKRDGKRNRRSHEFERDGETGRMRHDGEMGEDDEEMMFVRGASPHRLDEEMDKWDREGEDEDRGDMGHRRPRTFRGRGGGMRRGERQRGRGRGGRGSMRGNKRKRDDVEMCHFFLQGKCHRGSECPYAHEIRPPRKPELCKFYMKDCCAKKDKCLYMHSEFPCKYFHTGLKCYANKKCKFNHGPLTDQMNKILANHLELAPKDILGEFPRRDRERGDMRDGRGDPRDMRHDSRDRDMRDIRGDFMRGKADRDRKIPSLFDIKVSIPEELRNAEGNHTPMPSPTQRSQDSTRSSDREREMYSPNREREREREKEKERERERERERDHEKHKHEKSERSKEEKKERKAKREKAREHRKERREKKEREKEKKRERSKDALSEKNDEIEHNSNKNPEIMSPNPSEDNIRSSTETAILGEKHAEETDRRGPGAEENGLIPQHLPKKQRELFLRIQQQQREADSSQASANDDDDEDDKMAEENWYSSDEETPSPSTSAVTSLPSILQGLTAGASSSATTMTTSTATSSGGDPVMPLLNLLASASAAAKPLDVNTSTTPAPAVPFIPPDLDLRNLSSVFEALTSLQKMSSANKQAEQQPTTPTTPPGTASRPEPPSEPPKPESAKPEPPRVRDPRLRMDGDVDLRLKATAKPQIPSPAADVDLRSLPFKPVQHSAASEIDASLSSHMPLTWQLVPADVVKADYTSLQIQPRPGVNDPRLRRVVRPSTDELGLPRDPRQRLIDEPVRDPRARGPLLATPPIPPSLMLGGPPPTPRYDEDHRPQFYRMDSDMRQFPPPTPRMDDEVYTPGPSRPVDPRRKQFPPRPDDIDLRPPMAQRVPFVNFK